MNQNPTNTCFEVGELTVGDQSAEEMTGPIVLSAAKRAVIWSDEATMIYSEQCTTVVKERI